MSKSLSILYLGPLSGTCLDRANALRRLSHNVHHLDLRNMLPKTQWVDRITWRLGGNLLSPLIMSPLKEQLHHRAFDLCYVDGGEWVTPSIISLLRSHAKKVINYNIDDPLGPRDRQRFKAYRQSLPYYDINVVIRKENVAEAYALSAKKVLLVHRSADEISHAQRKIDQMDYLAWASEVLFLGTWFPERSPFLVNLIKLGVPLTIRGANWHKAPEWKFLKNYWKGGNISGDEYAKAIQCAKVNLGLLSKENRDLHTTRSLEIPALGGLLCAQRTSEHLEMYIEGREALFWKDEEECAEMCKFALVDENRRKAIAASGHARLVANGHFNEIVMEHVLSYVETSQH